MNPIHGPAGPQLVHDIAPPKPVMPTSPAPSPHVAPVAPSPPMTPVAPAMPTDSVSTPITAELVHDLPVRQQQDQLAVQVAAPVPANMSSTGETDMDKVLQDVGNRVRAAVPAQPTKTKRRLPKPSLKLPAVPKLKLKLEILAAVIVAGILCAGAVIAFRGPAAPKVVITPARVGTSPVASDKIQAAGSKLVSTGAVDSISKAFESKLNSLNDSQDFDTAAVSDQTLGL